MASKPAVDLAKVEEKMSKARALVVMDQPFFAALLLKRPLIKIDKGTFAVDARGNIYYNPEFAAGLSVQQVVFALVHEVFHIVKMDFLRRGDGRDARTWNIAGDAWINKYLKDNRIGEPIPKCVNCDGGMHIGVDMDADTTEAIYERVPKDQDGQGGYGDGAGDYGIGDDFVDDGEPLSEAEKSAVEAQTKVDIASAAQAAKMQGKMPGSLQRIVDEVLYVRTPWEVILERFMVSSSKADYSWKRPNKRYRPHGYYLPSTHSQNTMGRMALIIDTSGSVGDRELQFFAGHLNAILEQCHPEEVQVIYCDAAVNHVDTFAAEDYPVKLTAYGGGGTDLREGFDYIDEELEGDVACCVVLTDCYTPWPDPKEVAYPTIVLSIAGLDSPFETVKFEMGA